MASLPTVPIEILVCIADELQSSKDFNALTRASCKLCAALTPYLYSWDARKFGSSVLLWTATGNCPVRDTTARLSLSYGAYLYAVDKSGHTALSRASRFGRDALLRMLLDYGAHPKYQTALLKQTPLCCAASKGHVTTAALLLERGADINLASGLMSRTPLIEAAICGHLDVAQLLMKHGVDVCAADKNGRSS